MTISGIASRTAREGSRCGGLHRDWSWRCPPGPVLCCAHR